MAVSLLLVVSLPSPAWGAPLSPTPAVLSAAAIEDAVSGRFNQARAAAHLRRLTRIRSRRALQQIVCTAAATGLPQEALLAREAQADSTLFALDDLAHLPPDLMRVAEYDDRRSANNRRVARYAVAAFPSAADPSLTWVGIALYWSPVTEYFALHLTRSYDPPDLTNRIVPQCRGLR